MSSGSASLLKLLDITEKRVNPIQSLMAYLG